MFVVCGKIESESNVGTKIKANTVAHRVAFLPPDSSVIAGPLGKCLVCATPRRTMPHHPAPRCATPRNHATPGHTMPDDHNIHATLSRSSTPRHAMSRHTALHCATPRHATPTQTFLLYHVCCTCDTSKRASCICVHCGVCTSPFFAQ